MRWEWVLVGVWPRTPNPSPPRYLITILYSKLELVQHWFYIVHVRVTIRRLESRKREKMDNLLWPDTEKQGSDLWRIYCVSATTTTTTTASRISSSRRTESSSKLMTSRKSHLNETRGYNSIFFSLFRYLDIRDTSIRRRKKAKGGIFRPAFLLYTDTVWNYVIFWFIIFLYVRYRRSFHSIFSGLDACLPSYSAAAAANDHDRNTYPKWVGSFFLFRFVSFCF